MEDTSVKLGPVNIVEKTRDMVDKVGRGRMMELDREIWWRWICPDTHLSSVLDFDTDGTVREFDVDRVGLDDLSHPCRYVKQMAIDVWASRVPGS